MSTLVPRMAYCNDSYNDDDDRPCQSCQSFSLKTDWAQGDRVCTNCGTVDEGHLLDTRPEWMSYQDDEGPNKARSGMQPVDESKYLGGLQPTTLSSQIFGGVKSGSGDTNRRKQLVAVNKKMDYHMEKQHKKLLQLTKLDRVIRLKNGSTENDDQPDFGIRPDHDQAVENAIRKEKEDAVHHALYSDKWSMERAMTLHGDISEQSSTHVDRDDLLQTMDKTAKKASDILYQAYSILKEGHTTLNLPDRVLQEASHMLVKYATQKDGLSVKGVSSRLSENGTTANHQAEISQKLREFNQRKQSSALTCALLFLTARNLGYARSLQEVVKSFTHIKTKHCSKAIIELKEVFPEFSKQLTVLPQTGLVEHAANKLELPPVAKACILILVQHMEQSVEGSKSSTLCASISYFVCQAGDIMQGLAKQSQGTKYGGSVSRKRKLVPTDTVNVNEETGVHSLPAKKGFDVFSDAPLDAIETAEYEMRRLWDAWLEQMSWTRTSAQVELAFGVSRKVVLDFYAVSIHPRRTELLQLLASSATKKGDQGGLADTPRATVLLSNIASAATIMTASGSHGKKNVQY